MWMRRLRAFQTSRGLFRQIALRLLIVSLLIAVLDVAIVLLMYTRNHDMLAHDLVTMVAERVAQAFGERVPFDGTDVTGLAVDGPGGTRVAFAVFDLQGRQIARVNPSGLALPASPPGTALLAETVRQEAGGQVLLAGARTAHIDGKPVWVRVAIEGRGLRLFLPAIRRELFDHVVLPLVPLSLLLLAFNIAVVRQTLVPLAQAVREVDVLGPTQAGLRLTVPDSPWEVRSLVGAVNAALDRMQEALRTLREFTADAAHELRTPLAVLRLRLDQLPASHVKAELSHDTDVMIRLVNQMLDMAHADALNLAADDVADLSTIATEVAAQLTPLAISRGRTISLLDLGSGPLRGNADAIGRALRNVVENALTHTPAGTAVELIVGPGPVCSLRDHGPGIAPTQRARVLRRFWRGDQKCGAGTGLGLHIVQSLVAAHGGTLEIGDAPGGGAVVRLDLCRTSPAAQPGTSPGLVPGDDCDLARFPGSIGDRETGSESSQDLPCNNGLGSTPAGDESGRRGPVPNHVPSASGTWPRAVSSV